MGLYRCTCHGRKKAFQEHLECWPRTGDVNGYDALYRYQWGHSEFDAGDILISHGDRDGLSARCRNREGVNARHDVSELKSTVGADRTVGRFSGLNDS